ncbi:MAG: flippase-like domain-containing protein [Bacteroidales bacterium]|nr:flippase-like domain-containing protein [Bacteroidales bacterium]
MKKKILTAGKIIFFVGLGLFFIWLFLRHLTAEEKKEILNSFTHANYSWILLSIILGIISHFSRTARWIILLKPMGFNPRFRNTCLAVFIGYFANLALPRLGEVSRCGILARYEKIPLQKSFGTVVTERGLDLIIFFLIFLVNFFVHLNKAGLFKNTQVYRNAADKYSQLENTGIIYYIAAGLLLLLLIIAIKLRHKISHTRPYRKLKEVITGFFEGMKSLMKIKQPYWFVFHSLFIWTMYLMMTWVVFFSLPETSSLGLDVGLSVLVFGTVGIMVVQGGIGIYPWIVAETLAVFGIAQTTGYASGWLLWSGQTIMVILAGIVSLILLPVLNNKQNDKTSGDRIQNS